MNLRPDFIPEMPLVVGLKAGVFNVDPIRSTMAWPKEGWGLEDRFAIRLSIGLEDKDDLIADLTNGFAAMSEG